MVVASVVGSFRGRVRRFARRSIRRVARQPWAAPGARALNDRLRRLGLRRSATAKITVSVILPIYNVEAYLDECLDSLQHQRNVSLEIIVVDDGSPDGSLRIAQEHAGRDPRIVIVHQLNRGLGAARNTGVRHACGTYLTFVDSDDRLPRDALRSLVGAASSGSAMIVGPLMRFDGSHRWAPHWVSELHRERRRGIRIADFPELVRNNYSVGKLYRRTWWLDQDCWFREGVAYEDQPLITELYGRATSIDVITEVVYEYRRREDGSSISQQTATLEDLKARVLAWHLSWDSLRRTVPEVAFTAWLMTLFNVHFHWYLKSPSVAEPTYWAMLRQAVLELTDEAGPAVWRNTMPQHRVLIELARMDRPDLILEFVRQRGDILANFTAVPTPEGLRLNLPFQGDPQIGLRDDLYLLRRQQLRLSQSLERLNWQPDGRLRLIGWVAIRYLDTNALDAPQRTTLTLRHQRTGARLSVSDDPGRAGRIRPLLPPPNNDKAADYRGGAYDVELPVDEWCRTLDVHEGDLIDVELSVGAGGLIATEPLIEISRRTGVSSLPAAEVADRLLVFTWIDHAPLKIRVDHLDTELTEVRVTGRRVSGSLVTGRDDLVSLEATPSNGGRALQTGLLPRGAGRWQFELDLSGHSTGSAQKRRTAGADENPPARRPSSWRIRAITRFGRRIHVRYRDREQADRDSSLEPAVVVAATRFGRFGVLERPIGLELLQATPAAAGFAVTLRRDQPALVEPTSPIMIGLANGKHRSNQVELTPAADGDGLEAVVSPHSLRWRFGELPLPSGTYKFVASRQDGLPVPIRMSPDLLAQLPLDLSFPTRGAPTDLGTITALIPDPSTKLLRWSTWPEVRIDRPLAAAETRTVDQANLQTRFGRRHAAIRPAVLLHSYFGEQAVCNGVGLQTELQSRGSELPIYWAVRDGSVPVPDGGIPVVWGSREWYELISSVRYYLDNMFQPDWHHKPNGQVIMQTFHGYPFKTMGYPLWDQTGLSRDRIDSYTRRAAEWDYLISPARYATPLLRRDFGFDGAVLETGYPRNDVLQSERAGRLREQVRRSLGLRPDQTAVLYAPTFRDYLSADGHTARFVDLLDTNRVLQELPDVVLLVRGHAFNARTNHRVGDGERLVDVTDYPEVADLYLAADAAVADYSSLRFDFGVTGKPMIFHVPDLERYRETRGWLFDFETSAPGPLTMTTDEAIEALRDLPGLALRHAAAYGRFRADYLSLEDGRAAARLVDAVFVPRGDAPAGRPAIG